METSIAEKERNIIADVKRFVAQDLLPISLQVEKEGRIPPETVEKMRKLGFFGLAIPQQYGGLGLSTLGEILVYEELTGANACFRSRIGTSNSIGSIRNVSARCSAVSDI